MEHTTGFPCRVYCPVSGRIATAKSRDTSGLVLEFDDEPGAIHYGPPSAFLEVVDEQEGRLKLITGQLVLVGSTEVPGASDVGKDRNRNRRGER